MPDSNFEFKKMYAQNTGVAANPFFSPSKLRLLTDRRLQESDEKLANTDTQARQARLAETEFVEWL